MLIQSSTRFLALDINWSFYYNMLHTHTPCKTVHSKVTELIEKNKSWKIYAIMSQRSMYKHVCMCKCVPFPIKTNNNKNNRADTWDMQRSVVRLLRRILEVDMHTSSVGSADLQDVSEGTGSAALSKQGHLFFLTLCMDVHFRFSLNEVKSVSTQQPTEAVLHFL